MTLTILLILVALHLGCNLHFIRAPSAQRAQTYIVVCLTAILLTAGKELSVLGYNMPGSQVFWASLIVTQCVIWKKWGHRAAHRSIKIGTLSLMVLLASVAVIAALPTVSGNELYAVSLDDIVDRCKAVSLATVVSFLFSQTALVVALNKMYYCTYRFIVAVPLALAVQTISFVPIALFPDYGGQLMELILSAWVAKLGASALMGVCIWRAFKHRDVKGDVRTGSKECAN